MSFNYETVKDLIRCPRSMSALVLDGDSLVCTDPQCRLQFAIRDDIPCLLEDEASELSETDWKGVMARHRRGTASSAPR
jgi:uncharacterized protein YbaR (Trm112 family)